MKSSAAALAGLTLTQFSCSDPASRNRRTRTVRFGIVTDCHYADADTNGTRYYRESLRKLGECIDAMNAQKVDFLVELGDFKDQDSSPIENKTLSYLKAIERVFHKFDGPTYHVLGNHDTDSLSKKQFLTNIENTDIDPSKNYYSFDFNDFHLVVLDANYKSDGTDYDHGNFDWTDANIPPTELKWLKRDLDTTHKPVIVIIHQLLDGTGSVYVKNASDVRQVLEQSGKVLAVLQGHHHDGSYSLIEGIHYYTLKAMVEGPGPENNSYAIVEVLPDMSINVIGYRKAISKQLGPA
ncbi:MAG: metallophosphoesterase [Sedimentisphaerales bacterium]|nr:metallophosphoesterase [Sedimentisphaerales bacterium]